MPTSDSIMVRPQKDGRVSLARLGVKPHSTYRMDVHPNGTIILMPVDDREETSPAE